MAVAAIAGVAAIGGAIWQEDVQSDAHDNARDARIKQGEANAKILQEQKSMKAREESVATGTRMRDQALARQRALAASAQGRNGTILTSPLGVTQASQTTGTKTILGS